MRRPESALPRSLTSVRRRTADTALICSRQESVLARLSAVISATASADPRSRSHLHGTAYHGSDVADAELPDRDLGTAGAESHLRVRR